MLTRQGRILGIDPGLATTGWGLVQSDPPAITVQAFGVFKTPAHLPLPTRLCDLRAQLSQILTLYKPSAVAIEELFFTKFAVSIAATAQARGVILVTLADAGIPIFEYNPRAVKMALTGFGSASKIQMQTMLTRSFGLKEIPTPDDAADAVAMALCHLQTRPELKAVTTRRARAQFEADMLARSQGKL